MCLLVKEVSGPPDEVRKLRTESKYPGHDAHNGGGAIVVDFVVDLLVTDERPAIDREGNKVEEHTDARSKTH